MTTRRSLLRRAAALLCAASLTAQQAGAATTWTVTNTADSGAGSLRAGLTSAAAGDTVAWGTGSGGTITLLSALPGVGAGTILDVSAAPSAVTVAGFSIPLAGAATFANGATSQGWTVSSVISGAGGSLTKTGSGSLILGGVNTYDGGTSINGGTIVVSNDNNLGNAAGGVAFSNGTLQTATGITSARTLTLNIYGGTIDTANNNSTFSGQITGSSSLSILGTGKVTLTGAANNFTGGLYFSSGTLNINNNTSIGTGQLTFADGTLQLAGAVSLANNMTFNGSTATIDTAGFVFLSSGNIGGGGALNILGAGAVTMNGSSSYSGGTAFQAGTLNINNASSLGAGPITFNGGTLQIQTTVQMSNPIYLNAAGGTIDTLGNASTLVGIISGGGSLTNASTGTLMLNGINTYAGGTKLNAGALAVNNNSALGTGAITFNGGTLQPSAKGLTIPNAVTINAGGGTIDTQLVDFTLSGAFAGAGALTVQGGGVLILSNGTNAWGGATTVNGNTTLRLGANSALPAATALTVNTGSVFDLQGFTQTVASYIGAGTTQMVLKTAGNNLTVTGNANFTGGKLYAALPTGTIATAGQQFTPVGAGTFTGLPTVTSPAALTFTPSIVGGNLVLTTSLVPFANTAATGNQAAIGAALEPIRASPSSDATTVLASLYSLNTQQLRAALDQIGPASLASMGGIGLAGASVQSAAVSQRMAVLADGRDHRGFTTYSLARRSAYPGTLVAQAGAGDDEHPISTAVTPPSNSPWGFFASGLATAGRLAEATNAAGTQPGYAFNSGGVTGGADYRVNDYFAAGLSAGYLHGHASIYSPASGTVDDNSARFGVYGTGFTDRFHSSLYLGGAADSFTTKRGITVGAINRTASASPRGTEFNASSSVSYDFKSVEYGIFSPFGGLNYNRLMIGAFSEDGAGSLNLSVAPQTSQSLQSNLGLRYSMQLNTETRSVVPYLSLGWRHEFQDQSRPISARFADGSGNPFAVTTGSYARDGTVVGMGIAYDLFRNAMLKFDYGGDFRSHFQDSMFNLSGRWRF